MNKKKKTKKLWIGIGKTLPSADSGFHRTTPAFEKKSDLEDDIIGECYQIEVEIEVE